MRKLIILFIIALVGLEAQEKQLYSSQEGRYFLVGFMKNEIDSDTDGLYQQIFIASRKDNQVKVIKPDNTIQEYTVPANGSISLTIDNQYEHQNFETVTDDKLFRIIADDPVTVNAYSTRYLSSDMLTVFPVNSWGNEYYLTTMGTDFYTPNPLNPFLKTPRTGEALIMAAYDNTEISIYLNSASRTKPKGSTITITLNSGDSYLLGGAQYSTDDFGDPILVRGANDLTGTKVTSNKPIGVITGHMRTSAPQTDSVASNSKDHINEMLVPTNSWDTKFITIPFNFTGDNYFKVIAKDDNTNIKITKDGITEEYRIDEFEYIDLYIDEIAVWESDKPIQILQFMARKPETLCKVFFDPAVLVVNPVGSFVNNAYFQTPEKNIDPGAGKREHFRCSSTFQTEVQYEIQQVTILMDQDAVRDIQLDNAYLQNIELAAITEFELGGKRYFYRTIALEPGSHFVKSESGKFTMMNYGTGIFDSYAHSTGISIFNENAELDVNPPKIVSSESCKSFEIDAFDNSEYDLGIFEMLTAEDNTNIEIEEEYNFANNGILVTGNVIDYEEDAKFSATFYDYQNLATTFSYTYSGIKPQVDIKNDLGKTTINSPISSTFSITNNSSKTITLIDIVHNSKIVITNPLQDDYIMSPGEKLVFDFTIDTNGELGVQYKQIIAVFDCEITKSANIKYEVNSILLEVTGHDFQEVYLEDYASSTINITNTGTGDLYLDRLEAPNNIAFSYDLANFENTLLKQGESKLVSVTFTPVARQSYSEQVFAFGTAKQDGEGTLASGSDFILGTGVAPHFKSIDHNFGTNWLGNTVTESFTFTNTGNIAGLLQFDSFTNLVSYSQNSEIDLQSINSVVEPGDSFEFDVTFEPSTTGDFAMDCNFITDWQAHPEINFTSIGTAIQEEINPIDNCSESDTIFTQNSYQRSYSIVVNAGEEEVAISDIRIQSIEWFNGTVTNLPPTDPRFQIINANDYINQILTTNQEIDLEFQIYDLEEGVYRITINTDYINPNPDSENDIVTIESLVCLSVEEIPAPSINMELGGNLTASPCVQENFRFELQNLGNVELSVESLEFFTDGIVDLENFALPIEIQPGESAFFDGTLLFSLEDETSITFSGEMKADGVDETINFSFVEDVVLIPENIFGPDPEFTHSINDNGTIAFEFEFPYTLPEPLECEITIKADPNLMYLTEDRIDIYQAKDEPSESSFQVEANHIGYDLFLEPNVFTLNIKDDRKFYFEVPFLFLLSHYYETEIEFNVNSNKCFLPLEKLLSLDLEGVCVYNYRPIKTADDALEVSIKPNSDQMELTFETPGDTPVQVWLTDIRGAKVSNFEKKFVNNGKHSLYYDLKALPNGNYFLNFQTNYLTRNRIIIKSN